jgi:uncharacterized protein (TIGR02145 family)
VSPLSDTPIGSEIVDQATREPLFRVGKETAFALSLINHSGEEIVLNDNVATFDVYLPTPQFFTEKELGAMSVTLAGWTATFDFPMIHIVRSGNGTWAKDETITFPIAGAVSTAKPGNATVVIGPSGMDGNVPASIEAALVLADEPQPGNLSLSGVLSIALDAQGIVYRSPSADDPVINTLYLTIKNTGATAIGTAPNIVGKPRVEVSFVYGNTSGALTFDKGDAEHPPTGSAWGIKASLPSQQLPWRAVQPKKTSQMEHPAWTLEPVDPQILGPADGDQANITVAFDPVITTNPLGHTQMLVLFTGFARDEQTEYDDHLFVLDIAKENPPTTRGLLSLEGPDPVVAVRDPLKPVEIELRWSMSSVARVQLLTSVPSLEPWEERYKNPRPLAYGQTRIRVPAPRSSQAIFATMQAFTGTDGYLNSRQFTVFAQVSYLIDPGGTVYPTALFGDTFWMLANYNFPAAQGSYVYKEDEFGRLYDLEAAQRNAPTGWQLPADDDWQQLFDRYGGDTKAYPELTVGASGFAARLGGRRAMQPNGQGKFEDQYVIGYYWTAVGTMCAQFSDRSKSVGVGTPVTNPKTALSVRYIRRA